MKIDFVLPWVDPMDLSWQEKKEQYSEDASKSISNASARYRDMETLKYVLRAIEKHCPWYNKIILITEGHYPEWLDINNKKIQLVTHEQLYKNKDHLPTFCSSSIEMNLANIPDLSEYFVYLNDDMLIMKDTPISRFFVKNQPVDFLEHGSSRRVNNAAEASESIDVWSQSVQNDLQLINKKVGVSLLDSKHLYHNSYTLKGKIRNLLMKKIHKQASWLKFWHHPQPYTRSTLLQVAKEFNEPMMICSANRFRKYNNLNQYLYRFWHLFNNNFYPMRHNDNLAKMNVSSLNDLENMLTGMKANNIRFVCFNDTPDLSAEEFNKVKVRLNEALNNFFPDKATFEL